MIAFKLNDKNVQIDVPATAPLLAVLSNDLGVNGTKFGCG